MTLKKQFFLSFFFWYTLKVHCVFIFNFFNIYFFIVFWLRRVLVVTCWVFCSMWDLSLQHSLSCFMACGILVPPSEIEPLFPAFWKVVSQTRPLGKSLKKHFLNRKFMKQSQPGTLHLWSWWSSFIPLLNRAVILGKLLKFLVSEIMREILFPLPVFPWGDLIWGSRE